MTKPNFITHNSDMQQNNKNINVTRGTDTIQNMIDHSWVPGTPTKSGSTARKL